jgi:DNA polymerase-1
MPVVQAIDTETMLVEPGRKAPRIACLTTAQRNQGGRITSSIQAGKSIASQARQVLQADVITACNLEFDAAVLARQGKDVAKLIWEAYDEGKMSCLVVREKLRRIDQDTLKFDPMLGRPPMFDLAFMSDHRLGIDISAGKEHDAWRYRYRELIGVGLDQWPQEAKDYALSDAEVHLRLYEEQRSEATGDAGRYIGEEDESRASFALHLISARGLKVDPKAVHALKAHLEQVVADAKPQLVAAGLMKPAGGMNQKAVQERVKSAYAVGECPVTPSGEPSYSELAMNESGDLDLQLYGSIKKALGELSKYTPMLEDAARTGYPICCRYDTPLITTRVSASKPPIQQLPRRPGVRECFKAREGHLLIACDYDKAELVTLGQYCLTNYGYSELAKLINSGLDPHWAMVAELLSVSYEEIIRRVKAGDSEMDRLRTMAKVANFGIPGGLGENSLLTYAKDNYQLDITAADAKRIHNAFTRRYPEISGDFFEHMSNLTRNGRASIIYPVSGILRGGAAYPQACNAMFQSVVAVAAKRATYEVARECFTGEYSERGLHRDGHVSRRGRTTKGSPLWGSRTVVMMHDELIVESPRHLARAAAQRLSDIMVRELRACCPDMLCGATPALMDRWHKKAKPVYDDGGRLRVWRP